MVDPFLPKAICSPNIYIEYNKPCEADLAEMPYCFVCKAKSSVTESNFILLM